MEYKAAPDGAGEVQRSGFMHDIQGSVVMMVGKVKNAAPKQNPLQDFNVPHAKRHWLRLEVMASCARRNMSCSVKQWRVER